MGDTSLWAEWLYPVGADGRFGGGDMLGAEKEGDGCALVFGADSTYD
jgi:hypothetical protein